MTGKPAQSLPISPNTNQLWKEVWGRVPFIKGPLKTPVFQRLCPPQIILYPNSIICKPSFCLIIKAVCGNLAPLLSLSTGSSACRFLQARLQLALAR